MNTFIDSAPEFPARDEAQREAAALLLTLHQRLLEQPPVPPRASGLWAQLQSRLRPAPAPVRGLYLWGGVGRGKTCLMDWFVDDLPMPGKRRVHFHHFMREVHATLAQLPKRPNPLEVVADRLCAQMRVLCLDEFLVTDITDAMLLYGLFRALFARGVTLVTTSNTPPDELYKNGLQRSSFLPAIALLKQHTEVFELDGRIDYRLQTLEEAGLYVLESAGGEERMAADFARLSGGHEVATDVFTVNGRTFPVRALGRNVVWFGFDALCGTPRSVADYIEIATEFHTVLLSGVPQLDMRQDAAARRFLHLVDEFYDRRIKLLVSAVVPLADLYAGGLHEFAHERLLSRLREMQSAEYLAETRSS